MNPTMNRSLVLLLQVVIVLIGLATLAFLLGEPHFEGRNAHATTFAIYFKDPFLAYVYLGSVPFFIALCRAFALFVTSDKPALSPNKPSPPCAPSKSAR